MLEGAEAAWGTGQCFGERGGRLGETGCPRTATSGRPDSVVCIVRPWCRSGLVPSLGELVRRVCESVDVGRAPLPQRAGWTVMQRAPGTATRSWRAGSPGVLRTRPCCHGCHLRRAHPRPGQSQDSRSGTKLASGAAEELAAKGCLLSGPWWAACPRSLLEPSPWSCRAPWSEGTGSPPRPDCSSAGGALARGRSPVHPQSH